VPFLIECGDTEVPLVLEAWFFNPNCGCAFSLFNSMRGEYSASLHGDMSESALSRLTDFCRVMHRGIIFVLIIVNILNEFSLDSSVT
jgi:hypothetical protein